MDDGRNVAAYEEMHGEVLERIEKLRAALKKIADMDEYDGLGAARLTADFALSEDDHAELN